MTRVRTAVVTGANRGIGREIARQLRDHGLRVLATAREPVEGLVPLDVTQPESIAAFARGLATSDDPRGVDVLVNNAGASFSGFDADVAQRTLDVNFFGPLRVTDALLPLFSEGGRIVMVSSGMGTLSHVGPALRAAFEDPGLTRQGLIARVSAYARAVADGSYAAAGWPANAYSVSKVALNALVRVLARELASDPRRLVVNAADPGWVRTRMGGTSAPRSVEEGARTPVWLALTADGAATGGFFRDERPAPW